MTIVGDPSKFQSNKILNRLSIKSVRLQQAQVSYSNKTNIDVSNLGKKIFKE